MAEKKPVARISLPPAALIVIVLALGLVSWTAGYAAGVSAGLKEALDIQNQAIDSLLRKQHG